MSKYDIRLDFEFQNMIFECQKNIFVRRISHIKIVFLTSKYDIRPDFECQNRILNVKIRYAAPFLNVKIEF